jgi:hypothetical protein
VVMRDFPAWDVVPTTIIAFIDLRILRGRDRQAIALRSFMPD